MANGQLPMLNLGGANVSPEVLQQQQALNRQQQMAQLLMQQGMTQPQGQMVSGRYVAPSFFQYAAPLAQLYAGQSLAKEADKQALDYAKALRKQYADEMENYLKIQRGQEATPEKYTEMAGPFGEGVGQGNTDIPMPVAYSPAQAAIPPNQFAANLYGSTATNPVLQQMASKKLLDGPQWKEITQVNRQTGDTEIYRYDANSANPRDTLQFLGVSKTALSPSDIIKFRDEGIPIPSQYLGGQPVGTPQGQAIGQPVAQPQVAPTSSPTVASTQPKNPFVAPPPPPTLTSAKEIREWKADQAKPLTGTPNDIVNGAKNYQKAIFKIQELFDQYTPEDLLKPNVRAIVKQAVENARLQGKEANKLGALTGPDYGILEKLVVDPTAFNAFLVDRNTINKIYNNERMFTSEIIKSTYETAQKAVPENLREFVEVKPKELATSKPKDDGGNLQTKLRALNIPYQPRIWEYRINPDGSVDRKRKTQ